MLAFRNSIDENERELRFSDRVGAHGAREGVEHLGLDGPLIDKSLDKDPIGGHI